MHCGWIVDGLWMDCGWIVDALTTGGTSFSLAGEWVRLGVQPQVEIQGDTMSSQRVEIALKQLESARIYLMSMLEGLDDDDWFWTPDSQSASSPFDSNIAWQVGHIAMAEYGLMLFRQRGRAEIDLELMPGKFRKRFAKGSVPSPKREDYPAPSQILAQLEMIHQQVWVEVPEFVDAELDEPLDPPHAGYASRYGAMLMAPHHEMLHCGQIGMLRRLMGKVPIR